MIVGSLGFLGNILCFVVLLSKDFATMPMNSYLRVYSVNSCLICLLSSIIFIGNTKRLFPALNCFGTLAYFLWVYIPGVYGLQVMAQLLDIVVTMDRIGFFNYRVKAFMTRIQPRVACAVFLVVSLINGSIYIIKGVPFGVPVGTVLDTSTGKVINNFVIWVPGTAEYAKTEVATMFFTVWFFVRESILLVGEIVPNCVSLYYLKDYYSKKMAQVVKEGGLLSKKKENTATPLANTVGAATTADQVVERVAAQQMAELSRADRSATVMALVLCSLSILSHTLTISASLFGLLQPTNLVASNLISQIYAYSTSNLIFFLVSILFYLSLKFILKSFFII
jgi:hypothetical protein